MRSSSSALHALKPTANPKPNTEQYQADDHVKRQNDPNVLFPDFPRLLVLLDHLHRQPVLHLANRLLVGPEPAPDLTRPGPSHAGRGRPDPVRVVQGRAEQLAEYRVELALEAVGRDTLQLPPAAGGGDPAERVAYAPEERLALGGLQPVVGDGEVDERRVDEEGVGPRPDGVAERGVVRRRVEEAPGGDGAEGGVTRVELGEHGGAPRDAGVVDQIRIGNHRGEKTNPKIQSKPTN
ncbi:biotin synthase [Striga asiatica]|uniref:Biotin synthase n=1 Tax=Striga asiatica TaxID=4170 RepID=A0A5A7PN29_STRAF|nr:biotin synthase [Striga asiatica]